MNARILIALTSLLLMAAADDDDASKDRASFKGEWGMVAVTADGRSIPKSMLDDTKAVFDGKTYKQITGGTVLEEGEFELDAKADPKTIDLVIKKGADAGKTQLGLYKVDDKRLTLCLGKPGEKDRPKAFESKPDSGATLFVFEQAAAKDKDKDKPR